MRILITGIHGFVGSNLTGALNGNHTLYGLDIVSPEKEGIIKTYSWLDLENNELPEVDVVIHLAGKAHDTKDQTEAQIYFDINTGLTQRIFDWFLVSGASKFIFFSSVKAAANNVPGDILTEEVVPSPVGPYGESKLAAEKFLISRLHDYTTTQIQNDNKKVYILRPCMIHGLGNKGNLNLLYKVVKKGIPWPLGSFKNRRSFLSVDNLCFVINELISKEIPQGIYNIGDDEPISTNHLIELIAESKGKKAKIWRINKNLISFCARIGDMMHLPLNSVRLKKLTESYVVSNSKLKQTLGIENMPVSAEEGMKKTLNSF